MKLIPLSKIVEYMYATRVGITIENSVNMIPSMGYFPKTNADFLKLFAKTFMTGTRAYGTKSKDDFTVRFNKMPRIFGYCYTNTAKYHEIIKERNDYVLIFYNSNLPIKKLLPIIYNIRSKFAKFRGIGSKWITRCVCCC